jgi:CubicO group peptidase (beta-lactamase class C family)
VPTDEGFCGVALVLRGTSVLNEVVGGIADRETGALCTPDTRFQVASVSKQFTAAAILLLVQRGRVRLDDPIERWLPGCPAAWRYMTVHHLLTHTSGIGHWDAIPLFDPLRPADAGDLVPLIQQSTLRAAPGRAWSYSSPGYILLGQVVQAASGDTYAAFLSEHIFTPLGLSATSAGTAPAGVSVARGYRDGQPVRPWEMSLQAGTGNIWSTAADLTRFTAAVHSAALLTTDSRQAMFAIHAPIDPGTTTRTGWNPHGYGYGWFIGAVAGHPGCYHPGDNPGYQSFNARLHDPAIRFAVLTNDETTDLGTAVADLIELEHGG